MTEAASTLARLPLDTVVALDLLAGTDAVLPRLLVAVIVLFMENTMGIRPVVVAETHVMHVAVAVNIASAAHLVVRVVLDVVRLRLFATRILTCLLPVPSSLNGTTRSVRV
jgi:hypothetical protein